jgi:hypothetical protein
MLLRDVMYYCHVRQEVHTAAHAWRVVDQHQCVHVAVSVCFAQD